jgi:hypothetical protein
MNDGLLQVLLLLLQQGPVAFATGPCCIQCDFISTVAADYNLRALRLRRLMTYVLTNRIKVPYEVAASLAACRSVAGNSPFKAAISVLSYKTSYASPYIVMRERVIETVFSQLSNDSLGNVLFGYTLAGARLARRKTVSSRFDVADALGSLYRGKSLELTDMGSLMNCFRLVFNWLFSCGSLARRRKTQRYTGNVFDGIVRSAKTTKGGAQQRLSLVGRERTSSTR